MQSAHAADAPRAVQQPHRHGFVQHRDAGAFQRRMQGRGQMRAAPEDMARKPAPEGEPAVDLERLPPERRLEPHAVAAQPQRRVVAARDQHLGEFGVAAVLRQPSHVVEILFARVGAEIDASEVEFGDVGCQAQQVRDAVMDEAERSAGERGIACPGVLRRHLQQRHARAGVVRGERGVRRRVAGTDHQHVDAGNIRGRH